MRYHDAGVDVARADAVKGALGELVKATWGPAVRPLPRGFAGAMVFPAAAASEDERFPASEGERFPASEDERFPKSEDERFPKGKDERPAVAGSAQPLLAATMDGVGTKLHVAIAAGRVADAAADLVYHGANDLLVHGGRPLAFLDYVAQARIDPDVVAAAVAGMARACREVGAALLGGETAEMPDTYLPGVIDVAGCMIGTIDPRDLLDGSRVRPGDALLGLASAGLHTNGFSLARRVLAESGLGLGDALPGGAGERVGDALLAPHRWYGPALLPRLGRVHALAHVTGGGLAGNLERVLPAECRARVRSGTWPRPPLFQWLMRAGRVPEEDARAALNLGIGMVVACAADESAALAAELARAGETVFAIGEVVAGETGVEWTT